MASKGGRPTARLTDRGAATKARIVAGAATLVREYGVAGTSLDAVMTATGTSRSQLYHYFENKDALIGEVIKTQFARVIAAQEPLLSELSSWEGLQRWCDHLVSMVSETQGVGGCPLGSLVSELADRSESARQELARSFADWQSYLSKGFAAMRANGELAAEADADDLALTMMSALQGGLLMGQATRSARPLELALNMALGHVARYRRSTA
ncbi:TetR/AcrR family transcriptional regulator [Mycobacterium bohemicum]|jgi:AcrR family transcriptional regulator|uniref:TetR family transcriptional regulator n=1 Tax=Mycobacterium bohemicum TaxID=56425 RepID=A0A1X1RAT5_MYCBE|nr:TetR/AcrR family transcriptional regulator [Mycobacterium bohemicum]MCV6972310.1 TetR/AcrR family transcriptional regulator [Mycobacterium bohemicum]ORV02312.1 TetR family transcriptional regulator [Mycobacterium bohemicum]